MYLYVDGIQAYTNSYGWSYSDQYTCGNSNWGEREDYIDITIDHTASSAEFYFTTSLNQGETDESWALSDFVIEYVTGDDDLCVDIDTKACLADSITGYPCKLRCDFD